MRDDNVRIILQHCKYQTVTYRFYILNATSNTDMLSFRILTLITKETDWQEANNGDFFTPQKDITSYKTGQCHLFLKDVQIWYVV